MRRFNRTVTQRVGALDEKYLRRGRSLGESRVLWEVGEEGCDVRRLRARLSLDSGYLSRLLRSLEAGGLVRVGVDARDRRVRTVHLTAKGRRERAVLDERSDRLATALLEPLTRSQRQRLVTAMAEVERLLTSAPSRWSRRPGEPGRPPLPPRVRRRARPPVPDRLRHRPQPPPRSRRPASTARRARRRHTGRRARRLRRPPVPRRRRADRAEAHVGVALGAGAWASAAASSPSSSGGRPPPAPCSGSTPTAPSSRRSRCTARPGGARSRRSTTSRSPTIGSRSGSTPAERVAPPQPSSARNRSTASAKNAGAASGSRQNAPIGTWTAVTPASISAGAPARERQGSVDRPRPSRRAAGPGRRGRTGRGPASTNADRTRLDAGGDVLQRRPHDRDPPAPVVDQAARGSAAPACRRTRTGPRRAARAWGCSGCP